MFSILYFSILHNALCLPPKFCINYCCGMLLGICRPPKIHNNSLYKIWGANRVHYGQLENSEYCFMKRPSTRIGCLWKTWVELRPWKIWKFWRFERSPVRQGGQRNCEWFVSSRFVQLIRSTTTMLPPNRKCVKALFSRRISPELRITISHSKQEVLKSRMKT